MKKCIHFTINYVYLITLHTINIKATEGFRKFQKAQTSFSR